MFSHPIPSVLRSVPTLLPTGALRPEAPELIEAVPPGRIVEICGEARASTAARILATVQASGDVVAWVAPRSAGLFPPDLAAAGLDLDGLVVVHVPENDTRAGPKAAELLLRTGAIGAVVLEADGLERERSAPRSMLRAPPMRETSWQGRLSGILREHGARLLLLSGPEAERESLGPLVSVRLALRRRHLLECELEPALDPSAFSIEARVTKDKSGVLAGRTPRPERRRPPLGA